MVLKFAWHAVTKVYICLRHPGVFTRAMHDASDSNSDLDLQPIQAEDAACECGTITSNCPVDKTAAVNDQVSESHSEDPQAAETTLEAAHSTQSNVNQQVSDNAIQDNVGTTSQTAANQGVDTPRAGNDKVIRKYSAWKCILYSVIFLVYFVIACFYYDLLFNIYVRNQISDDTPKARMELYALLHSNANLPQFFQSFKCVHIYYLISDSFDCFLTIPFSLSVPILPYVLTSNQHIRRGLFGLSNLVVTKILADLIVEWHFSSIEPSGALVCFLAVPIPYAIVSAMCFPDTRYGQFVLPVQIVPSNNSEQTVAQSPV